MKSHWIATNSSKNQNSVLHLQELYLANINKFVNNVIDTQVIPEKKKKADFSLFRIYEKNSHTFEKFVQDKFSPGHSRAMILAMRKFFVKYKVKSVEQMKDLMNKGKINKKSGTVGYRGFLNFIEEYSLLDIDEIDKFRRQIKIYNNKGVDRFIPNIEQIKIALKYLKETQEEKLYLIYRFVLESGCRFTEAIQFFKTYEEKYLEIDNKLCCYSNFYIRGKKSSYYLLFTKSLYDKLKPYFGKITDGDMENLKRKAQRYEQIQAVKYLRKVNFSMMLMNDIPSEIADLIAGRSQKGNVGFNHYLDQKSLVKKHYARIVDKMEKLNE